MKKYIHIDIETYSPVDLLKSNVVAYSSHPEFEILVICYSIDGGPVETLVPSEEPEKVSILKELLQDPNYIKIAHNAAFEMNCLNAAFGVPFDPSQWQCTMVMAYLLNLPGSLKDVSAALGLEGKMAEGKALITYFCKPCKPTKVNGGRLRNLPEHSPDKWKIFCDYCAQDVKAEIEVFEKISWIMDTIPCWERNLWILDQKINKRGIKLDMNLVNIAVEADHNYKDRIKERLNYLTGLENPNSLIQLKAWIKMMDPALEFDSLDKAHTPEVIEKTVSEEVKQVLKIRSGLGKTSTAKYEYAKNAECNGKLYYNLMYAKAITARWGGAGVQPHNLPRVNLADIDGTRNEYLNKEYAPYGEAVPYDLSQLVRTMFIPEPGHKLIVMDFSAIEARLAAWVAGEKWVLDVFRGDGKIYEATASRMFGLPIESINHDLRQDGKTGTLACGYGGGVGAIKAFKPGWDDEKCLDIVMHWREANPKIVALWYHLDDAVKAVIGGSGPKEYKIPGETSVIRIAKEKGFLTIELPSGRKIYYARPMVGPGKHGFDAIYYYSQNQVTRKWELTETYGGKLFENIIQAIARDLLAMALLRLDKAGYDIVFHVHDEVIVEVEDKGIFHNNYAFEDIKNLMAQIEPWATREEWCKTLPLDAAGFIGDYYKKE